MARVLQLFWPLRGTLAPELGDNLGNTRVTFDTQIGSAVMTQQDDYYPFGLEISKGTVTSPKNEYLYNRKELQEELTEYDYGARFYDPVIGRWNVVDPLAGKSRKWSPYNYAEDNPVMFIDPDGMEVINADKEKRDAAAKNVASKALSALGYGAKDEQKGGKKDLKRAINSLKTAEKAFEHTEKSINTFKNVDPAGFKKVDNLTYNDKSGNSHPLDVLVSSGDVTTFDKGKTSFSVSDVTGIIDNGATNTLLDNNTSTSSDVLAHELGHSISIAADPFAYKQAIKDLPDPDTYDCQSPANRNNPLSVGALKMQAEFDRNQKILSKALKFIP